MKRLTLDFLARWWWLLAIYIVVTIGGTMAGQPFVFTPLLLVCLLFDAQRGLFRAVRPLPVSRREQAVTWWLLGVLVLPIVSVPTLAAGTMFYVRSHAALLVPVPSPTGGAPLYWLNFSPWFAAGVTAWVGLGFAAFCFLLCRFLPTRPPNDLLETIAQSIVAMLWGLSMPGSMLLLQFLPKMPEQLAPWHWVIFALVPVCVVLSFVAAPDVLQRRTFAIVAGKKKIAAADKGHSASHGLVGVPLFLAVVVGRGVAMIILMVTLQLIMFEFMSGWRDSGPHGNPMFVGQIVGFALLFASLCGEWAGLRVLRTLPLSTAKLAGLLLCAPVAFGIVAAVFSSVWGGIGDSSAPMIGNFVAQAVAIAGLGSLAMAISLHVTSGLRILVLIVTAMLPAAAFIFLAKWPLVFVLIGGAAFIGGTALLHRGLCKSSVFYQPRRMLGMTIGQPVAVR
jgi:hypothetical protein